MVCAAKQPRQAEVCPNQRGYSLFELIIVIIIVGILATITMRSLRGANETARVEETREELDQLAAAIAGDPALVSGGSRTDFGYIGDVGALPASLDALVQNPGYATWKGPYLRDDFVAASGATNTEFKRDAWGSPYTYTGGLTIGSAGGGSPLTRRIGNSLGDLLDNSVGVVITDLNRIPPGSTYRDSVQTLLTIPDGSGGYRMLIRSPGADGLVMFDSIPIGNHQLQLVYLPDNDTLQRQVAVEPGHDTHLSWQYPRSVW